MYKAYYPGYVTPECCECHCRAPFDVTAEDYCNRQDYYDSYKCPSCHDKEEGDSIMYVIKFYSKKWKGNAFYNGVKKKFPLCYAKKIEAAKGYTLERNAKKVASQLSELSGVVHGTAIKR